MNPLESLKQRAFENPEVQEEYEQLEDEFSLIDMLLFMRTRANLTQEELARKIGTKRSNICRLEKGRTNPRLHTLERYAQACGYTLRFSCEQHPGEGGKASGRAPRAHPAQDRDEALSTRT